jgi:hypothetical protein
MRYTALAAIAALIVSTGSAFALDSSVTMPSSISPDALWKKVGDFCGISSWHPAIEKCVLSADGKQRTLSLKGGGTIVEALENWDDAIVATSTPSCQARCRSQIITRQSA